MRIVGVECELCKMTENTARGFELSERMLAYTDSVAKVTMGQSVIRAQNAYVQQENIRLQKKAQRQKVILWLIISLFAAIMVGSAVVLRNGIRRSKMRQELILDEYQQTIRELREKELLSVNSLIYAYYSSGNNTQPIKDVHAQLVSDYLKNYSKYEAVVDGEHGGVITKLKDEIPNLGERYLQLFTFILGGLSYTTIGVIFGKDRQYVYNLRAELVQRIRRAGTPDEDEFMKCVPNRRKGKRKPR